MTMNTIEPENNINKMYGLQGEKTMYINKKNFLQFALDESVSTIEDGKFFKVMQNGILYIAGGDFPNTLLSTVSNNNVTVFGFVYNGKFYSTHYSTHDIDLNFYKELNAFEDKFDSDYAEAVKAFSPDNPAPVTNKTKEDTHRSKDFEYYCEYIAKEAARNELFGISYSSEKSYDNRKFLPIFIDCLKHPENYYSYIQNAVEENAHIINYRIKCDAEKQKAIEALKADTDIMYRLKIYRLLMDINGKTVKMSCVLYGETFELSIDRECFMRCLWSDNEISLYNFTSKVRGEIEQAAVKTGLKKYEAKILFTDIRKITYGGKVIFVQEK